MNAVRRAVWLARLIRPRLVDRPWWRWRHRHGLPGVDADLIRRMLPYGRSEAWLTQFRASHAAAFGLSPAARDSYLAERARLELDPGPVLARAESVCARRFELLGSAPTRLSTPIDWKLDFKSGLRFPGGLAWTIDYRDGTRASDVKVPWEVARFHSALWLGQGYWLSGDERYARIFADLTHEWLEENPPGEGIHWACPMELAIRAINWSFGLGFFGESPSCETAFWQDLLGSLVWHGRVIEHNLEYGRRIGNHLVADAAGLYCLGVLFREAAEGRRWLARGHRLLEQQVRWQVFPDGPHYEQSVSYHRLVTEFFAIPYCLARRAGLRFSREFGRRLEGMFDYARHYSRPDGSTPLIGDADDGRLLPFGAGDHPTDHRHLLGLGGALTGRADLSRAASGRLEDALWIAGPEAVIGRTARDGGRRSKIFRAAGMAVIQDDACHTFLDAGPLGIEGDLVHGHFDVLSFELYAPGGVYLSDSGCYAYTSDPVAYREHVATSAHNVPVVDGADQAQFVRMWRIAADGTRARVREWGERPGGWFVWEAEHHGYARLPEPVVHVRRVEFHAETRHWIVTDRLEGAGAHEVVWRWHAAPGVAVRPSASGEWDFARSGGCLRVTATRPLDLEQGWVAPSYGVRVPCPVLVTRWTGQVPVELVTHFQWMPGAARD